METAKTIKNFGTIINRKLDHSSIDMLGRNAATIYNSTTKEYIIRNPKSKIDGGVICTKTPTCVSHKEFEKIVRAINWHFGAKIHAQLEFDGVDSKSPTDFINSKGWHSLS